MRAGTITNLIRRWKTDKDEAARNQLFELVYDELHARARREWNPRRGETLRPTVLVNEVYLRFEKAKYLNINDRQHFFAVAVTMMRNIVTDRARRLLRIRHGAGSPHFELNEARDVVNAQPRDDLVSVVAIDEALRKFETDRQVSSTMAKRQIKVAELRLFAELTIPEIVESLAALGTKTSPATVKRDWKTVRDYLDRFLSRGDDGFRQS